MLGEDVLRDLLDGAVNESFERGDTIVNEGDEGDAFYVIRGGVVAVFKRLEDGEERTISYLRAGNYFGEVALMDGTPRSATVRATNKTEVIRIDRAKFLAVVERYPDAHAVLQKRISERLRTGEAVLQDDALSGALTFMAGSGGFWPARTCWWSHWTNVCIAATVCRRAASLTTCR